MWPSPWRWEAACSSAAGQLATAAAAWDLHPVAVGSPWQTAAEAPSRSAADWSPWVVAPSPSAVVQLLWAVAVRSPLVAADWSPSAAAVRSEVEAADPWEAVAVHPWPSPLAQAPTPGDK